MKKVLVIKTMIIALCLGAMVGTTYGQNDADPGLTSCSFSVSPIYFGSNTGANPTSSTLTVFFANGGFTTAIASGTVGLNISLPSNGVYKAFPESIATLSGTYAGKFNWTYNSTTKSFFGTNNQALPPGVGGTVIVTVKGYHDATLVNSVANVVRINPAAYPNENINDNNLSAALSVVPTGTTPITLLDFQAIKQGKTSLLSWQTAQELNSKNFDIQFSKDGVNWQSIGVVAAAGSSSNTRSYSFVHTSPVNGINYYRLMEVDLDAKFQYSAIRTVNFNTKNTITIMPNPTVDRFYITSNGGGTLQSVTLFSSDGKQVLTTPNFLLGNSIDMRSYAPGIYTIRIIEKSGFVEVMKVVKQ